MTDGTAKRLLRSLLSPFRDSTITTIRIYLAVDRAMPGTAEALGASGRLLSGPWPAMTLADALRPDARNAPAGAYLLKERLPAGDAERLSSGRGGGQTFALVPQAAGGQGILLHGGADFLAATDGSIRVPDPAIAEIASYLPPAGAAPVEVLVVEGGDHARWRTLADDAGSRMRQIWFASSGYTHGSRGSDNDRDEGNDGPEGSDDLAPQDRDDGDFSTADRVAAAGLIAAGYEIHPDAILGSTVAGPADAPRSGAYDR